ncbi:methyl-accepting chemotaxis protein [Permianibacter aggregans]|uniref:Methyl-accepting chemotaxis protein n=1 Tax=Permianibacter aggregans TaxID=1510150 RepID=A0A4R6UG44_9GAMM|nr:methyl-accepting chemotaxis protein [Permianibacter aggregans]QGX41172.1 methyl-accepting chemotaxis protein [Permianibacter aggregans]TDQ45771.1 methyl-accepting chemotaxis protein [Permianibacter aggregans]
MQWLNALPIRGKVLLIPIAGALAFTLYLIFSYWTASNNAHALERVRDVRFPSLQLAEKNLVDLKRYRDGLQQAVLAGEKDQLDAVKQQGDELVEEVIRLSSFDKESTREVDQIADTVAEYVSTAFNFSSQMVAGTADFSNMEADINRMNEQFNDAEKALSDFRDSQLNHFKSGINDANAAAERAVLIGVLVGVATVVLMFAIALAMASLMRRNLEHVITSLKDIAKGEGDLRRRIPKESQDEIGELVDWFNTFIEKLQHIIGDVVATALPLAELAQKLSRVTTETKAQVEEQQHGAVAVQTAVNEMNNSVESVAHSAAEAATSAQEADEQAKAGSKIVRETVSQIENLAVDVRQAAEVIRQLDADSASVGMVLDVIKGIAEQTNLLALNAAIEAARAGEQGRGFAVVADEVRTLASRTQQSTAEIQSMIERLQSAARSAVDVMSKGTRQAEISVNNSASAGKSLESITETVTNISQMNMRIASATEQQQRVARTIVNSVTAINEHSQKTSASAGRMTEVSNELAGLASKLEAVARQFSI